MQPAGARPRLARRRRVAGARRCDRPAVVRGRPRGFARTFRSRRRCRVRARARPRRRRGRGCAGDPRAARSGRSLRRGIVLGGRQRAAGSSRRLAVRRQWSAAAGGSGRDPRRVRVVDARRGVAAGRTAGRHDRARRRRGGASDRSGQHRRPLPRCVCGAPGDPSLPHRGVHAPRRCEAGPGRRRRCSATAGGRCRTAAGKARARNVSDAARRRARRRDRAAARWRTGTRPRCARPRAARLLPRRLHPVGCRDGRRTGSAAHRGVRRLRPAVREAAHPRLRVQRRRSRRSAAAARARRAVRAAAPGRKPRGVERRAVRRTRGAARTRRAAACAQR